MASVKSVGMIEMTSIGIGHLVQDEMLKAADVKLLMGRTICSGKYIVIVAGDVGATRASVQAGLDATTDGIIDHMTIANIHPDVFAALGQTVPLTRSGADVPSLGIIETFSAASALQAADIAAKTANISLFRIHIAMAIGGKGFIMMSGSVADCRAAVDAGAALVKEKGLLVSAVVIPRPCREVFAEHL